MSWNTVLRLQSFAQYFCIVALVAFFVASPQAKAALTSSECLKLITGDMTVGQQRECAKYTEAANECASGKQTADSLRNEVTRKCGDAGLSPQACISQMKTCASVGGVQDYKEQEDMLLVFSAALGVPQGRVGEKCPEMSGQDFFEEKEKLEKDLDDVNDDLAGVKKDLADLNKDFNEKVKEIQEEIAEAQKELKQKQLDIKKEQRERAAELAKTASELSKGIREKQSLILRRRQDINNIYRSKNSSLISISQSVTRRACKEKARKLKKEYESVSGGSSGSFIARSSQKKKDIQDEYDSCLAQFDQQRLALIEQTDQKIEQAQDEINSAQSDIDNMTQQLSTMNAQESEAKNDDNTALSNETTALNDKISRATAELQSLQQTTQQEAESLQQKQAHYQQKATRASNSLMQMESSGAPKKKSTASISQAQNAYDDYAEAVRQLPDDCPYKGRAEVLKTASEITGKKYSEPKSSTSKNGSR